MKKKNLQVMTFMSWENEEWLKNQHNGNIRAIALCDASGYFFEAINCMRDGSMGEKDDNGVYERHWYGDYISCYGNERESLRPATKEEVDLYLRYVSIEDAVGMFDGITKIADTIYDRNISHVIVEYKPLSLWQRFLNFIFKRQEY